jgi:glycerol uptake facilitator protein
MSVSPLFLGEFLGTLVLVLLGNGIVANVLLKSTKGENAGWLAITTGWGLAIMAGVFTAIAFGSPYGHINPAVSIGMAMLSNDYSTLCTMIPAQFLGAFVGSILVWLHYHPHWARTESSAAKLGCFSTGPAIRDVKSNLFGEALGTFVLVLLAGAIFSKGISATGPAAALGPYLVGAVVWVIGLGLGGTTGFGINPARDFGPRLVHAILPIAGKGSSDWGYSWIPVVGPVLGAIAASYVLVYLA